MDGRTAISCISTSIALGLFLYSLYCARLNYLAHQNGSDDGTDDHAVRGAEGARAAVRLAFGLGALLAVLALSARAASWPPIGNPLQALLAGGTSDRPVTRSPARPVPTPARPAVHVISPAATPRIVDVIPARPLREPEPAVAPAVVHDPPQIVPIPRPQPVSPRPARPDPAPSTARPLDGPPRIERSGPAVRSVEVTRPHRPKRVRHPETRGKPRLNDLADLERPAPAARPERIGHDGQPRIEGSASPEGFERPRTQRRAPAEGPEWLPRPQGVERRERAERSDGVERPERTERRDRPHGPEEFERPDRKERRERAERPARVDRPEQIEVVERVERVQRIDRPHRLERLERRGRLERRERFERRERPQRFGVRERLDRPRRGGRRGS